MNIWVDDIKPKGDTEKTFLRSCDLIKFAFSIILIITCLLLILCPAVQWDTRDSKYGIKCQ